MAGSTNELPFTPTEDIDGLTLEAFDMSGASIDLGQPQATDGGWTLTVQSSAVPAAFQTVTLGWTLTKGTQRRLVTEKVDVLPDEPLAPYLVNIKAVLDYCQIDAHEWAAEAPLIASLIEDAGSAIEGRVHRYLEATQTTESCIVGEHQCCLNLRQWPVAAIESITDPSGVTHDVTEFAVKYATGILSIGSEPLYYLAPGEWRVTYTGGLSARSDFETSVLPRLKLAARIEAADLYLNRNPRASSEKDGDTSVTLTGSADGGLCPRAEAIVAPLAGLVMA